MFVARRNANGEGSRPRRRPDGRWEGRYWIETSDGHKRHSVYGATRKECAEKLADAMAAKHDAPVFVATNIKVAEFFRQYEFRDLPGHNAVASPTEVGWYKA